MFSSSSLCIYALAMHCCIRTYLSYCISLSKQKTVTVLMAAIDSTIIRTEVKICALRVAENIGEKLEDIYR